MGKRGVHKVVPHRPASMQALASRVNAFYIEVVERRLNQSGLTPSEKILVIDGIISNRRSREAGSALE